MRKYFNWNQWEEVNKEFGFRTKKPAQKNDAVKKKARIEKFCKCKECGGQMTYVKGTNTLICDCEVERQKEKAIRDKFGNIVNKEKITVKEPCGNVNIISEEYMGYVNYLFN